MCSHPQRDPLRLRPPQKDELRNQAPVPGYALESLVSLGLVSLGCFLVSRDL